MPAFDYMPAIKKMPDSEEIPIRDYKRPTCYTFET